MGVQGKWKYELKSISVDLLDQIAKSLEEGECLLPTGENSSISLSDYVAWITSFSGFIDVIDPHGEDFSGSLRDRWYHSRWLLGNNPNSEAEWTIVFRQYLGVARSLLLGKAKVTIQKMDAQNVRNSCIFHRRNMPQQDNLVFVLMPFVEPWSDYIWRREIQPIVEQIEIDSIHLACRRADDLFGPDVMQDIYESIATARIVIAEITNRNANVFYELGMAHTLGKDVIILSQGTAHIPFDLNRFRHCIYSNDGPGYEKLRSYLPSAINSIFDGASI